VTPNVHGWLAPFCCRIARIRLVGAAEGKGAMSLVEQVGDIGAALRRTWVEGGWLRKWRSSRNRLERAGARSRINRHRTIWISDVHLGTRGCKADLLCDFLRHNECELLYLVGDIVDGWRLTRSWYWHESHNAVIDEILRKADAGTRVVYIPGNHDEAFRDYVGLCLGGIELATDAIHETAAGERQLVLHGDQFDAVVTYARWLAHAGDWAHAIAVRANDIVAAARRRMGLPYWSLSGWLKSRMKDAVEFINRFEEAVAREAQRRQVDGVICGHIHKAEIRQIGSILYCNDGDWVESCTALAEDYAGNLRIMSWNEAVDMLPSERLLAAAE
jgi:UDP-2,3-diacylglucosamine pyrophosphatase LpxH